MRAPPFGALILASLVLACPALAQERLADLLADPNVQLSRAADRARVVERVRGFENTRRQNARARAARQGLPLRTELPTGRIQEISDFNGDRPVYLTTNNVNAAISTGADLLRTSPYSLNGSGVTVGVWDGGAARSTHQEFGSRITVKDASTTIDHATHVAGTIAASGFDPAARGMAASATVDSYDWTNDVSEMTSRGATSAADSGKIYLSNHSYNYVSGWNYVNGGSPYRRWEWYGSGTTSTSIETDFGIYNIYARDLDSLVFNAPYYLIFRSAGNDGTDNPSSMDSVALAPGGSVVSYNAASHPAGDGNYRGGFETIAYSALSKNVITVGAALDAVTSGTRDPSKATLNGFSACGPTDDGRIKPDVVANGDSVYSSLGSSNTAYGTYSGTSMATPNATGSASLLIQQYGSLFPGQAMRASTLKGLLIHTADDLGNTGPDYKFGWGLVNAQAAADLIIDHYTYPAKLRITENQLTSAIKTRTHSFEWDGVSPIRATLVWTDPAGAIVSASDSRTPNLVNNLNLKIIAPNSSEFFPYVMPFVGTWTQAAMNSSATTGINNTDNVEQVRVAAPPAAGIYQAVVTCPGTLTGTTQNYSLLLSGSFGEPVAPPAPPADLVAAPGNNTVNLSWTAAATATSYSVKRSLTAGGPYTTLGNTGATSFTDVTAVNGTTYFYVVSATNSGGQGTNSAETSATPAATPSTTTLASSLGTAGAYNNSVTFTATVGGAASGTVTFRDGSFTLGAATLNGSGQATFATSALTVGSHSITAAFAGNSIFGPSTSAPFVYTVNPKAVTITGVTAANKIYDKNTAAALSGGSVSGIVAGETVIAIAGTGTFDSANAGLRSVTATGYSLGGANAGNYFLTAQPAVPNATITPLPVQLTGTRPYDGSTVATDILSAQNNLDGPDLTITGSANLAGRNAGLQTASINMPAARVQHATGNTGSNTMATFSVTLSSAPRAGNTLIAVVSARSTTTNTVSSITQTGASWSRVCQAVNSNGTATEIWTASNVSAAGTTITFNQALLRSAAVVMEYNGVLTTNPLDRIATATGNSNAPVTGTTATSSQGDELWIGGIGFINSSHTLTSPLNGFSAVTSAQSTRSTSSSNAKVYALEKFVNSAAPASSGGTLSTTAQWSGAIATFRTQTPTPLALSGPAAANYTLAGASGSVLVTPRPVTVTAVSASKTYDGTTTAAGIPTISPPLIAGDTATSLSQSFHNSNAGIGNKVIIPSIAIDDGNTGANYAVALVNNNTSTISPAPATIELTGLLQTYTNTPKTVATTPVELATTVTYDGSASAPTNAGTYAVIATVIDPNYQGTATGSFVIEKAPATIELTGLLQTYTNTPKSIATTPVELATAITYDGSATAPTNAGTYAVIATVIDPNYQGTATGSFVIEKAPAAIELTGLLQTYTNTPKTVATTPVELATAITYDGSATAPTNAETYAVIATVIDPNYQGTATGSFVIEKAPATIELTGLLQTYTNTPKTVATTPVELATTVTYDGSATPPTNAGTYAVTATVIDPNYQGTATGSFVIEKAPAIIELTGLLQTYTNTPKAVATTPVELTTAITYDGSATAPTDAGTYAVIATVIDPNYQGAATGSFVIEKAHATIELTGLLQTYTNTPKSVATTPVELATAITYDGSATPPTNAGTYAVTATVIDPNYQSTATGSFVIEKAPATIELTGLLQTYTNTPKSVATTPVELATAITYDGSATPPTNAGTYAVTATVIDPNYQGTATGSFVIEKAPATIELTGLLQTYDTTPKSVATTPVELATAITYDGSASAPTDAGTYAVTATVIDPNYQGTATASFVIALTNDLASWRALNFTEGQRTAGLADESADPDGDGWINLAEYALGRDPHQFSPPLVPIHDENGLSITFTRPADLPGISYGAESTEDFQTWTPVPLELLIPGTTETLRARDPLATGDPSRRYLRLRIERP